MNNKQMLEEMERLRRDKEQAERELEQLRGRTIGGKVASARKSKDLNQQQLAKRLRVNESVISRLERNKNSPRIDTLERIAKALGMRLIVEFQDN